MKAEEFYKQRSNSIRELWALSPKQIEYIALIMEEYAALRQPPVMGELACDRCGCHPNVIYTTSKGRFCERCKPAS